MLLHDSFVSMTFIGMKDIVLYSKCADHQVTADRNVPPGVRMDTYG